MTLALLRLRPTVAELDAKSKVLQAKIKEMRAIEGEADGCWGGNDDHDDCIYGEYFGRVIDEARGTTLVKYQDLTEEDGPTTAPIHR